MENSNNCKHCGSCCIVDTINIVKKDDIKRWEKEGRRDILEHVRMAGDVPIGFKKSKCPFYDNTKNKRCSIEETKPEVCKRFPLDKKHARLYTNGRCKMNKK